MGKPLAARMARCAGKSLFPIKDKSHLVFFKYCDIMIKNGLVAQLGERTVRIRKVEGSIPFGSTITNTNEPCGNAGFVCCAKCSTSGKLPHPIRLGLCKSKVSTTGREFGCCAVCSTKKIFGYEFVRPFRK